jgi:hypothetical protein
LADDNRSSWLQWLDGIDTAASMLAIVLLAAVTGAVLTALYLVVTRWPEGYGLGPQGEGFYLSIAFILVIGWVLGQLTWIMRRRRRSAWTFGDGSEIPLPKISPSKTGFSIHWGASPDPGNASAGSSTWSATLPVVTDHIRTFRLDSNALDAAREARASGAGWEEVCRQVNAEWRSMTALDRALYRNALEAAVDTPEVDPKRPTVL